MLPRPSTSTLFPYTTLFRSLFGVATQRFERTAFDDRNLIAREFILGEEIAHFHFNEIEQFRIVDHVNLVQEHNDRRDADLDRKSTRLNSSHLGISYAVFCLK